MWEKIRVNFVLFFLNRGLCFSWLCFVSPQKQRSVRAAVRQRASLPHILSDWSSAAIVLVSVTTHYMRPKPSFDFSRTVSTFPLQSPASVLALLTSSPWNIEFLSAGQLTQNSGALQFDRAASAFLIKAAGVKTVLRQEEEERVLPEERRSAADNSVSSTQISPPLPSWEPPL